MVAGADASLHRRAPYPTLPFSGPHSPPKGVHGVPGLIFLAIGLAAGVLSGLFGIGGGLLIVPTLVAVANFSTKTALGERRGGHPGVASDRPRAVPRGRSRRPVRPGDAGHH